MKRIIKSSAFRPTMTLDLHLGDEALLIGSGKNVTVLAFSGLTQQLGRLPGKVRSLVANDEQVLAAGNFQGIRDVQSGKIAAGGKSQWRCLTTTSEKYPHLYGAKEARHNRDFGVFTLTTSRPYAETWRRYANGQTTVLYSVYTDVFHGGEYIRSDPQERPDPYVESIFDHARIGGFGSEIESVVAGTAVSSFGHLFPLYALPFSVRVTNPYHDQDWAVPRIHFRLSHQVGDILEEVVATAKAHDRLKFQRAKKASELLITSARDEKQRATFQYLLKRPGDIELDSLAALVKECASTWGISCVAAVQNYIFLGTNEGLVYAVHQKDVERQSIIYQSKDPVLALAAMPQAVFEATVRAKMARRVQMRAIHAQKQPARLRRVA